MNARWEFKQRTLSVSQWGIVHSGMARTIRACGENEVIAMTHDQLVKALAEFGDVDTRPEHAAQARERFVQ